MHECLVCGYDRLWGPPEDFLICPSCGTEFGYDDASISHEDLRAQWLQHGAPWSSPVIPAPAGWDPRAQLIKAELLEPTGTTDVTSAITSVPDMSAVFYRHWRTYPSRPAAPQSGDVQQMEAEFA